MSTPDPHAQPDPYQPQQPPPPYAPYAQPPPYGYPYPPPRPTNGMAIAAMVVGIVGACNPIGVLGLIFGMIAKRQIRETGEGGDGFATAGVVLGWIGVASVVFWVLYFVVFASLWGFAIHEISQLPTDYPTDYPTDDPTWAIGLLTAR
ncbi:DUF4190 domain-containing protein [Glycomyces sp. NPDC046736]|uniref:DUF4190 domain-containing protein n=1 Tax=Glycomyces sp. NPDC046736 TaxID=3155615 RepID=UPI0034116B32